MESLINNGEKKLRRERQRHYIPLCIFTAYKKSQYVGNKKEITFKLCLNKSSKSLIETCFDKAETRFSLSKKLENFLRYP